MYGRRFLLFLAVTALALTQFSTSAMASGTVSRSAALIAATTQSPCAYGEALRAAGLLTDAETEDKTLLNSTDKATVNCAVAELTAIERQRLQAVKLAAEGDQAAAGGELATARNDYAAALSEDRGNAAAMSGLQKVDQQLPNPCAYAQALRAAGLLAQAEAQDEMLLNSTGKATVDCAAVELKQVESRRLQAVGLESAGDLAAAEGELGTAQQDYTAALTMDHGNTAAMSGLQKVDQEPLDSIREARDYGSQIVSNTLEPIGQFFLWLLALFAGIYILSLLTRVAARWLPVPPKPSWRSAMKFFAQVSLALAIVAAGVTAYAGVSGWRSAWWLALLIAAASLVLLGCLLLAWYLRSGTGVQFNVIGAKGDPDKAACADLAGRLNALGAAPPRGFDLPQDTDVTSLTGTLALLPGGGILSALTSFFLARVPVTPWVSSVTLINSDQLLVTLHHNGRLAQTVLANRGVLFFPSLVPGKDAEAPSPYVKDIDQSGMLTIAAAVILVGMAEVGSGSPLQLGLNGASSWGSVAGQVLATQQGFGGNEDLSKALLARAVDVDPGNLGALVAKIVMDGRRAKDPPGRKAFAERISEIWPSLEGTKAGYEALQLRVLYSAAAGWYNVYLDDENQEHLEKALGWSKCLRGRLEQLTKKRRLPFGGTPDALKLASSMMPMAEMLDASLKVIQQKQKNPNAGGGEESQKARTSEALYAFACLAAASGNDTAALSRLEEAVAVNVDLRAWARYDPSFKGLLDRHKEQFLKTVGDQAPAAFTAIAPLAGHAAQLNDIGVHTAADLLDKTSSRADRQLVAEAVGVSQLVVARWRNIALLSGPRAEPSPGQIDVLIAQGVDSLAALRAKPLDKLAADIENATTYSLISISESDLEDWARPQ